METIRILHAFRSTDIDLTTSPDFVLIYKISYCKDIKFLREDVSIIDQVWLHIERYILTSR